uniref:Uncharacterized protein n=1 Tax=Oryza sativa subsp. japonica TaxID=39947 RepID=Q6K768_ORYSJ|nr:hypothetical protein [Oryza sativa Japonica Group]BAD21879.1 hypothetical protein [Oryza sativa Japonica Group]
MVETMGGEQGLGLPHNLRKMKIEFRILVVSLEPMKDPMKRTRDEHRWCFQNGAAINVHN